MAPSSNAMSGYSYILLVYTLSYIDCGWLISSGDPWIIPHALELT